jgi:FO synthase subunit 2
MTSDIAWDRVERAIRSLLEDCLAGRELSVDGALALAGARGPALHALCQTADRLRAEQAGETVTYVVNRNINFTNVCIKSCGFCAFSRSHRSEEGYFLEVDEVVRRVLEARALGATEVCIQAGLSPGLDGHFYIDLCRAVKAAAPDVHVHAFSPEEVKFGSLRAKLSVHEYLVALKEAGLGSLPGTSAEILDDEVRARIAPGRISTAEWIDVIRTAHQLGVPTTSTIMFGHVENDAHRVRHMELLRSIQRETGGFTEFVPLSFVHEEAPMYAERSVPGLRPGPTGSEVIALFAIARLMLGASFRNIQVSWVKEGLRLGEWLLQCGANDLGGTLMNESISTSAGAAHGQLQTPAQLRRAIRGAGRIPAQRDTRYRLLRTYAADGDERNEQDEALDHVANAEATFGSYGALTHSREHRFHLPVRS